MNKSHYLIDDLNLPIYIDYNKVLIEVYRPLYRLDGHKLISKNDYLTIVKSIRDVIIFGEDIEFQYYRFGKMVYFIKNFYCQLSLEPNRMILNSRNLEFLNEPKNLEDYQKEDLLEKVDNISIRGL
jgi:hypothetical protein